MNAAVDFELMERNVAKSSAMAIRAYAGGHGRVARSGQVSASVLDVPLGAGWPGV